MSDELSNNTNPPEAGDDAVGRRMFLQSMGKWSGAAIVAAVAGGMIATAPQARGGWINRRGGGGGGWINGHGGGGGGWINGRGGGGGSWINRR